MEKSISDLNELQKFTDEFLQKLRPLNERAVVVTLSGNLGAGKTTFTQYLGRALGIVNPISSPTFVISKNYPLVDQKFKTLIHIDAYRLNSKHELDLIGFTEQSQNPENLIIIEWPEQIGLENNNDIHINIQHDADTEKRLFSIS